jgi:hypothetical protein
VLESLGDALAIPALDPLVQAESRLAAAVEHLRQLTARPLNPGLHAVLREDILRARAALERCQRLGGSLEFVVHAAMAAQGRASHYDKQGSGALSAPAGAFEAKG